MPPYRKYDKGNLENSLFVSANSLSLPTSINLTKGHIKFICDTLKSLLK